MPDIWPHISKILSLLMLKGDGVHIGKRVKFYGVPLVASSDGSKIHIGDNVVLCSDGRYTAMGVKQRTTLRTLSRGAIIEIGRDCGLSGTVICSASAVRIGESCLIGANVTIADTDFHPLECRDRRYATAAWADISAPVTIERNVFIGANSIILKGVKIGENSIIGAGSVVTRSIPPNVVAAGNPARILREMSNV